MLSSRLQAIGFMTEQNKGDADTLIVPLNETHLAAVRGLSNKNFQPKCVNEQS